ncbi:cyclin-dependent kinase 9-like [Nasonia vitripennis]|uniref:Protein kinase domain-containing protein n=1 Tax=Nasonia vitripennis TaxID=7425 RepID=A0A7M7T738_NASVI|nr:cyclin-dependent kinase 9-like [Nasonia vitripennis]
MYIRLKLEVNHCIFLQMPVTAFREVTILKYLKHENIVRLIEVVRSPPMPGNNNKSIHRCFYLALEYCEHDLAGLLSAKHVRFQVGDIKKVLYQLLDGVHYLHVNKLMHRDLKPANILINKKGVLKITDFGLARPYRVKDNGEPNTYTNRVVTLWYRPPELLLGERNYGPEIDMWSIGCILAEMWTRTPILPGKSEQAQLNFISYLCGAITPVVWPGVSNLPLYDSIELSKIHRRRVVERLQPYIKDRYACDMLDKLLVLDPKKRIDANEALDHDFFWRGEELSDLKLLMSKFNQSLFQWTALQRHQILQKAQLTAVPKKDCYEERIY